VLAEEQKKKKEQEVAEKKKQEEMAQKEAEQKRLDEEEREKVYRRAIESVRYSFIHSFFFSFGSFHFYIRNNIRRNTQR
jgi:hypothetical protein